MKKFLHIGMWILLVVLLVGCAKFDPQEDAVTVDKKGRVVRVFADEFLDEAGQAYDVEEIRAMMEQELSVYNRKFGVDHVILEECTWENGLLRIQIACDEAKYYVDYCGYYNDDFSTEETDVEFFAGTVGEAGAYDFGVPFLDTAGQAVEAGEVLENANSRVIILNEPILVETQGNILYTSNNVELLGKKQARVMASDGLERAYIIYK